MHSELYHNHISQKLPQFVKQKPHDINEDVGLESMLKDKNATVIYESNPENAPVEFKDVARDVDRDIDVPLAYRKKTHRFSRESVKKGVALRSSFKTLKKYREYK